MKILVLNAGSSSLKYKLYDGTQGEPAPVAGGVVERIGEPESRVRHRAGEREEEQARKVEDHQAAVACAFELLREHGDPPALADPGELAATGHRVVHGGAEFAEAVRVDDEVLRRIEACGELAPLHAGPNLAGLRAARRLLPGVPAVAVFDTAFFQTLPPRAFHYAIPEEWLSEHGVRRYGFHGTSHRYVAGRAAQLLGIPAPCLVTLHLGNGCSAACIRDGVAVDTSMGLTPLEGLVMGTRSGDLDPALIFHLAERGMSLDEIQEGLERRSGLLGLSGTSGDVRDLLAAAGSGDARASLALEVFVHRVRRYLGAYLLELGRCHAVVFTGGVGEHAAALREAILADLAPFGVEIDPERNAAAGNEERAIHRDGSATGAWVIPTDEEQAIAIETAEQLDG